MAKSKKFGDKANPLVSLYQILCNSVFEDEHGANETTYNALMILGEAIDRETAKTIAEKTGVDGGRFKYLE